MPTSATGTWATDATAPGGRARGFTLVEILVVVAIIALLSVGVLLSTNLVSGGKDGELQKESDRLLDLMELARDQAALQTREYGVRFDDDGYQFFVFDNREQVWRDLPDDDSFMPRKLPDGLDFRLVLDGRPVVLKRAQDAGSTRPVTPARPATPAANVSSLGSSTAGLSSASAIANAVNAATGGGASGAGLPGAGGLRDLKDTKPVQPDIMIFSDGELSSFTVTLERDGGVRSIDITPDEQGGITEKPMVEARSR